MSQEPLSLRRSVKIVRRHRILVGGLTAAGLLAGTGYAVITPAAFTAEALLVLPQAQPNVVATQVVLAESDPVLAGALPNVQPASTVANLRALVQASNSTTTSSIITITAEGSSAVNAEATANAVANSYIRYANGSSNPLGPVDAKMLEPATVATGTGPVKKFGLDIGIGLLVGLLIGFISALALGRKDRRLRMRDQIANSIGVPVLASFPVGHPTGREGWTRILDEYKPGVVHAWRLRKALEQVRALADADADGDLSVAVVSLSSDAGALAIGPQLAVFAASLGIWTTLVLGPQQDANVSATLRAACSTPDEPSSIRPKNFQALVSEDGFTPPGKGLTVVVVVLDPYAPEIPPPILTDVRVLGVSAGAATAEQLARVALAAAESGCEVSGILVADPDPEDRSTGRIPFLIRPAKRGSPHTPGIPSESRQ
jgi:capsular polysaccharide biosynthesis protein